VDNELLFSSIRGESSEFTLAYSCSVPFLIALNSDSSDSESLPEVIMSQPVTRKRTLSLPKKESSPKRSNPQDRLREYLETFRGMKCFQ
jgi:hypothetical protein